MSSIRETKKRIKKIPSGRLWSEHIRFWMVDSVNSKNNYRGISRFFTDVDVSQLSNLTGISKESLKKYFVITL